MIARQFASWLAPHFTRFVELKRAGGCAFASSEQILLAFDAFLVAARAKRPLRRESLLAFLATLDRLSPRARENVICVVWPALEFARRHAAPIEPPPMRPKPPSNTLRLRQPRILSISEIRALLAAAHGLSARTSPLRAETAVTLLGVLCATGMRIGEVLALDLEDFVPDRGELAIRRGKFGKARILPVQESTLRALGEYLAHSRRPSRTSTPSSPIFFSSHRRRLSHPAATKMLRDAWALAALAPPRPRLHDLRHSFVVGRVLSWYDSGREINALLPALSTYLGHVSLDHTRTYLVANGLLLEGACARFAASTHVLDKVQP